MTLLTTAYLKGKSACEAKIIQEKVVVYEKGNKHQNATSRLADGDAMRLWREEFGK